VTTQPVVGHAITAVQKTADGTSEPSSQPITVVDVPDPLPVPVILSALNSCMVDIWASGLVPGAKVVTTIGGQPFGATTVGQAKFWINPGESFNGYGAPPLRRGQAVAVQEMPRCRRQGQPVTLPVAAALTPAAPTVSQDVCPQALRLTVSGLAPGGILHVKR